MLLTEAATLRPIGSISRGRKDDSEPASYDTLLRTMTFPHGGQVGPYRIEEMLGSGGMGEVYKARDTRLQRTVAVKVLSASVSGDAGLRERFEREARTVATLQHPHICTLLDVGTDGDCSFLVMEYLDGETLASRLQRGPLPLGETLKIGIQVASALAQAHRLGIVHRDVKPDNVMLTRSGVKLLDFGLAKLKPQGVGIFAAGGTLLETHTLALTGEGTMVGTLHYMAPEQLAGKEPEPATDVFALGVMLYEMITGRRAFEGENAASVIAAVLQTEPPPLTSFDIVVPVELETIIRHCLIKDPHDRWQNALDLSLALGSIGESPRSVTVVPKYRRYAPWAFALVLLAVVLSLSFVHFMMEKKAVRQRYRLSIQPPEHTSFREAAISPNGRRVAFVAAAADGQHSLWVRTLNSLVPLPLPATEGASYPFWSTDSRSVGFFAAGKLKKIDVGGGTPQTLCDAPDGTGGTWSQQGVIVFAAARGGWLSKVSAGGGDASPVTALDSKRKHNAHYWPHFLPDGRRFVYWVRSGDPEVTGLYIGSLDATQAVESSKRIYAASSGAAYAYDEDCRCGYLLFVREGTLIAQPFDIDTLRNTGDPSALADQIGYDASMGYGNFAVSINGVLIYGRSSPFPTTKLAWFMRASKQQLEAGVTGVHAGVVLSHDGRRAAVTRMDSAGADVWLYDLVRGISSRLTHDPALDISPIWSRDGLYVTYRSLRDGPGSIYSQLASGTGETVAVYHGEYGKVPTSWSPDGQRLLYSELNPKTRWDIWMLSGTPGTRASDAQRSPFVQTEFNEIQAEFSPDGKWVAYTSDGSGRREIYVQTFPPNGNRWRISPHGGEQPKWRHDGKELYYLAPDGKLMAVALPQKGSLEDVAPAAILETQLRPSRLGNDYDVAPDGERFLLNLPVRDSQSAPLTVLGNWPSELPGQRIE